VQRLGRKLAERFGIRRLHDVGEGISHQIAVESGLVRPGQMVTNTDSHTITVGAVGAVGCGIGVAEMAFLWAHGRLWFQVPTSMKLTLVGQLRPGVTAKDLVLWIVKRVTARGAMYSTMEYHGSGLQHLGIPERMTLCNMGVEMGAKFAVVPGDEVTRHHYTSLGIDVGEMVQPDPDAHYVSEMVFDLSEVEPMVSVPNKVDNVHGVTSFAHVAIHQAFLGTCTNGRFEDLQIAARILAGRRVAPGVRMIVTPASRVCACPQGRRHRHSGGSWLYRDHARLRRLRGHPSGRAGWRGSLRLVIESQLPRPHGQPGCVDLPRITCDSSGKRAARQHH
jgi:homoaconitase/3-isopropylmalate dehydratase large subunit